MTSKSSSALPFTLTWRAPKAAEFEDLFYKIIYWTPGVADPVTGSEWGTLQNWDSSSKSILITETNNPSVSKFGIVKYYVKAMRACEIDSDERK